MCLVYLLPTGAQAEPQKLTYQVYAGGIHGIEAELILDEDETGYKANVTAKTRGWLGSLVPWSGSFATTGALMDGAYMPREHQSISTWKDETETKTFTYKSADIVSLTIQEGDKPLINEKILPELTQQTTDILSATLAMMSEVKSRNNCTSDAVIFDGKRKFKLYYKDLGEKHLKKSSYNIYEGPARYCTVEIEPQGGKWHKKPRGWLSIQEQGRQKGALPTLWIGKPDGFEVAIPVKIRVKTDYGTLFMHLSAIN